MTNLKIMLAQSEFIVGAVAHNCQLALACIDSAEQHNADVIVFPELFLTGYPPEDLLYRPALYTQIHAALQTLCDRKFQGTIIIGHPQYENNTYYNQASVIQQGRISAHYRKQHLPNYNVFDEKRYFSAGNTSCVVTINSVPCGITICEDLWHDGPAEQAKKAGAALILSLNASPFYTEQAQARIDRISHRAKTNQLPIAYVNYVGGIDELVFDGGSMLLNPEGKLIARSRYFEADNLLLDLDCTSWALNTPQTLTATPSLHERIYQALVTGVRDYVKKNDFANVLIGLSGGIDSSLTLAIAVDALGAEHVHAVLMPSQYTHELSNTEAIKQCQWLGCDYDIIPIETMYHEFMEALTPSFSHTVPDMTEQNLQARIRGTLLMALSNKSGALVLTTGNKSEMAVGYATLYGDMCGAFAVLKDVKKTLVYDLSRFRNQISQAIPAFIIEREPSAELAPDQKDSDSLPDYATLDAIIERFVEKDQSAETIISAGYASKDVHRVIRLIFQNEYKRQQAAIGTRITHRAFGKDRRYPITQKYKT